MAKAAHIRCDSSTIAIRIRSMEERDYQFVVEIDNLAFGETCDSHNMEESLRVLASRRDYMLRVATIDDGTPIGFCVVGLHPQAYEITRLAVLPSLHRRGIGRILVDELRSKLRPKKAGRRTVIAAAVRDAWPTADAAVMFLDEMGFASHGQMRDPDGNPLLLMVFSTWGWLDERRALLAGSGGGGNGGG